MTMMQMRVQYFPALHGVNQKWFMTITDPFDIAVAIDNLSLRYSNLLVLPCEITYIEFDLDNSPNNQLDFELLHLPGARVAVENSWFYRKSAVLYTYLKHGSSNVYRRPLYLAVYLEDASGGVISNDLKSYLETYLDEFYTNSDYILYDQEYNALSFHHLDNRIWFKQPYRFPIRGNNSIWYNP